MSCCASAPSPDVMDKAFKWTMRRMAPISCELPENFLTRGHFDEVLERLQLDSSRVIP